MQESIVSQITTKDAYLHILKVSCGHLRSFLTFVAFANIYGHVCHAVCRSISLLMADFDLSCAQRPNYIITSVLREK